MKQEREDSHMELNDYIDSHRQLNSDPEEERANNSENQEYFEELMNKKSNLIYEEEEN